MVEQNKLTTDVTPDNWQEVLSQLQERPGFNNFVWLDCREVELSDLGPIAVTLEGGTVQKFSKEGRVTTLVIGSGLVGSQVARILVERGEKPVLMDNTAQNSAINEIVDLAKVTLVAGDVLRPLSIVDVLRSHNISKIVHTAANPMLTGFWKRGGIPSPAIEIAHFKRAGKPIVYLDP
jgi:hypothetical protein